MSSHIRARRWIIWTLAVLFYFYEYFIRVAPSVMVHPIQHSFNIGAGVFGTMVAFYLYAYAPMQLPVGILMDRYGARKLLTLATLACGVSSLIFGLADKVWVAEITRLFMGAGSAFAFIGMVYICSHWFSGKMLASLVGVGNSIGMLGAVFGQGPLSLMVRELTWRPSMILIGVVGIGISIVIYLAVRNEPKVTSAFAFLKRSKKEPLLKNLKVVSRNPQTWINGIVALCFYTATVAFGGLWAIPFLRKAHHLTNEQASFAASMIYVGWIVAGPIIGYISDKIINRKIMLLIFTFFSIIFFLIPTYMTPLPIAWVFGLMFALGVCLSGELLNYTLAIELNPIESKGTALALTNFLVFLGGSFIQTLVGWILDWNWEGKMEGLVRFYSLENYQTSLLCFPIAIAIAFLLSFFIKEKPKAWAKK